jgi:hypothetical protein
MAARRNGARGRSAAAAARSRNGRATTATRARASATRGAAQARVKPGLDARFFGAWKLISLKRTNPNGTVEEPYGPNPVGIITYQPSGYMGVHIMRPDRKPFARGAQQWTPQELDSAFRSFTAYFGPWSVDKKAGEVVHHLWGSTNPNNAGVDNRRKFTFTGKRLLLQVNASAPPGSNLVRTDVTWEKLS